ncbi:MAG TPA: hypothetical protein VGJ04_07130 [Pirellulales bacterium]
MITRLFAGPLFVVALTVPAILRAADATPDKNTDSKQAVATPPASIPDPTNDALLDSVKFKGRLPSGWGKLGISDSQKQSIYKIQAAYVLQIDPLKKQLSDIEAKRDAEIRNVLTVAQQKALADNASAKVAKKAAAADAKKTTTSDAKPVAPSSNSTAKVAGTTK